MNTAVPGKRRFLVEWYRPDVGGESFDRRLARLIECAESTAAAGTPVHVLVTFAVFDADSPTAVAELC